MLYCLKLKTNKCAAVAQPGRAPPWYGSQTGGGRGSEARQRLQELMNVYNNS